MQVDWMNKSVEMLGSEYNTLKIVMVHLYNFNFKIFYLKIQNEKYPYMKFIQI